MEAKTFYRVAVYLRLSRDDVSDGGAESNSIGSQRDLICSYIRRHDDMELYDIYVDDGWSGANFDRPSFRRMMEDIAQGHIDCVMVKDLSRLGRDYIEAGRLIQKTFPAFCVRFIAINDNFDSLTADFHEKTLVLPVKNFINDAYCSDISKKVKSQQQLKRERGEYIGAFAAYGYRKDPMKRHRLLVDPYAAWIVKKIFAWKIAGVSNIAIAEQLNALGVLSPLEYKKSLGETYDTGFATHIKARWSAVAVKRILTSELYTGVMVQGKTEKVSHKVKHTRQKPREAWVRVADTHEALVSAEDFLTVQRLLEVDARASVGKNRNHMFAGYLYCGDCGQPMIRRVNRYRGSERVCFVCASRNRGLGCTRHSICEERLIHLVSTGLGRQLALFADLEHVRREMRNLRVHVDGTASLAGEIERQKRERKKYQSLSAGLYEDFRRGILTEEEYKEFGEIYRAQYQAAGEAIECQEQTMRQTMRAAAGAQARLRQMQTAPKIAKLSRDVLVTFINRILVYEDKRVLLELRVKNPYGDKRQEGT